MRKHRWDETHEQLKEREYLEQFPLYPHIPGAAKFRKIKNPTREQRIEHANVIETAILDLQRKELQRELPEMRPNAVSGTWANMADGSVGKAIRARQSRDLLNYPDYERRNRSDDELREMYAAAMKEKNNGSANNPGDDGKRDPR